MFRNTDSVLVVAGLEEPRESAPPQALRDLVRDAIVDVAQFVGVEVVGLPDGIEIAHDAGDDVEHILAELLDNAARASTEGTPVIVSARRAGERLELCVSDEGRGMPVDRLDALNEVLAHPPLPGLDHSVSVGLVAVARLAERIGATVTLRSATDVGTVATLGLPARILRTAPGVSVAAGADAPGTGHPVEEWTPVVAAPRVDEPTAAEPTAPEPTAPEPTAPEPTARRAPPDEAPRLVRFSPVPVAGGHDLLPPPVRHPRHRHRREGRRAPTPVTGPVAAPGASGVAFARVDRRAE